MEDIAAGLGRERLLQQPAGRGIAGVHQPRGHLEVLARLLLAPAGGPVGDPLQPEAVVAFRVADVAAGMAVALLQEDRLDANLEEFVIERRRRAQCRLRCEGYRQYGGCHDESRSRRRHVNPPVAFFLSRRNGMLVSYGGAANADYLLVSRMPVRRPSSAQSSSVLSPMARMPWAASSSSRSSVSPVTPTAPMTSPAASRICSPPPSGKIWSPLALRR